MYLGGIYKNISGIPIATYPTIIVRIKNKYFMIEHSRYVRLSQSFDCIRIIFLPRLACLSSTIYSILLVGLQHIREESTFPLHEIQR